MADEEGTPPKPEVPSWLAGVTGIIVGVTALMGAGIGALKLYPEFVHSVCDVIGCAKGSEAIDFDFAEFSRNCGADSGGGLDRFTTISCNGSLCLVSEVQKPSENLSRTPVDAHTEFEISDVDFSTFKNNDGARFQNILQLTCKKNMCMNINGIKDDSQIVKFDRQECADQFKEYLDKHKE